MKKFYICFSLLVLTVLAVILWQAPDSECKEIETGDHLSESIQGAIGEMMFTSSDVDLGYIPHEKLLIAIEEGRKRIERSSVGRSSSESLTKAKWRERGPNNIGGRTRAIMIDASDPNRNRIWIGGVSGGLWRSEDITSVNPNWKKLAFELDNITIGSIAQDPNNHDIIYVGTGEGYNNIDAVRGAGMFKSIDDGANWTWLNSTRNDNFRNIHEVYVHSNGDVYAATQIGGLYRSKNGGDTWEKVLGTGLSGADNNNFFDFQYVETNHTFYASNTTSIFKSLTGDRGAWVNIGTTQPGFPDSLTRVEFTVCATNPNVMYVIGGVGSFAPHIFVSNDGGLNWVARESPPPTSSHCERDFTCSQAWYDLEIAVDPFICGRVFVGGVTMWVSDNQGLNWEKLNTVDDGTEFHPDQHNFTFDLNKQGRSYFSNDGGIWLSHNSGVELINKNLGYVTTQFYCAAIHPGERSQYLLGGTQDNRSLQLAEPGISPARIVWPGDGMFCFIDQNEADIQIVSSQFGKYGRSFNGGHKFNKGMDIDGDFINRSGYDDDANILYGQINTGGFFRWDIRDTLTEDIKVAGRTLDISAVKPDPFIANRIYFGGSGGQVVRVDSANIGNPVHGTLIADLPSNASVSSFYMDKRSPDDMLITLFNYGNTLENVWISNNAGSDWISIEGDLPDMPVRWGLFDPDDHDRVMLATEVGIWVTDDVNGDLTHWEPVLPDNGMPFVCVYMLVMRESDKVVLAATHGRGLFTTDFFSPPTALILSETIGYVGQPLIIDGSQSAHAETFDWNLGDNTTSSSETFTHTYSAPGTYTISLTINDSSTHSTSISILPYLQVPYAVGNLGYAGDFELNPEHFAPFVVRPTGFQAGISTRPGKDGTHSGSTAWVSGLNDDVYRNDSHAELYTPMFDLHQSGLYELKFWTKYDLQTKNDGFRVEYSIDAGATWLQLGSKDDPYWYNDYNDTVPDLAFSSGSSYFTGVQPVWTQYRKDISFLAGQYTVSFKYVFKSDAEGQAPGLVIDDFEVSKHEGELKTIISSFGAEFTSDNEVTIHWTTEIEYQCQQFILERSFSGFGFSEIAQINATGVVSIFPAEYTWLDSSPEEITYYRLKVINDNPDLNYHLEFYTDPIVARRNMDPDIIHQVLSNPFRDRILISFSSIIDQPVKIRLYDMSGKLVRDEVSTPNGVAIEMDKLNLPAGIYILNVQIGDKDPSTYKLLTNGI